MRGFTFNTWNIGAFVFANAIVIPIGNSPWALAVVAAQACFVAGLVIGMHRVKR